MAVDRQDGRISFVCDVCGQVRDGDRGEEFAAAWAAAKRDGWATRKIANEWLHQCPDCVGGGW